MTSKLLLSALAAAALACAACGGATENAGVASNASAPAPSNAAAKPAAPSPAPAAGVRRISIDEALPLVEKGEAVFVDVRGAAEYQQSHIRGAINVPLFEVAERVSRLPKNKLIITYCA